MAISYATATATGSDDTPTLTLPAHQSGDALMAMVSILHHDDSGTDVSTGPSGWTEMAEGLLRYSAANWSQSTRCYYLIATGTSHTFSCTLDESATEGWGVCVVRARDSAGDLEFHDMQGWEGQSAGTALEFDSITGAPANSVSICMGQNQPGWITCSPSTNYTERVDSGTAPCMFAQTDEALSGTISPGNATWSNGSYRSNSIHAVFKPVGGAETQDNYDLPLLGVG